MYLAFSLLVWVRQELGLLDRERKLLHMSIHLIHPTQKPEIVCSPKVIFFGWLTPKTPLESLNYSTVSHLR